MKEPWKSSEKCPEVRLVACKRPYVLSDLIDTFAQEPENMLQRLPQHKASMLTESGILLRRIAPVHGEDSPVTYIHQDDYYVVGLLDSGSGCGIIDFEEVRISAGDVFVVQPGQVHRFVEAENAGGWILFVDSCLVGNTEKQVFDDFLLSGPSVRIDGRRIRELGMIASILADRTDTVADGLARSTAGRLAATFPGIVAEALQEACAGSAASSGQGSGRRIHLERLLPLAFAA